MRILYKASLVILVTDMYSKVPIESAVILCNGKQNPYVHKKDGYYVFSNLYPDKYEVSIKCKGYNDILLNVELRENETVVIKKQLFCTEDNEALQNSERFEFTVFEEGIPLTNSEEMTLRLEDKLEFIKLIKPVEAGSNEIYLNIPMSYAYMPQEYDYMVKRKAHNLFITGYDENKKCFILKDPVKEPLEEGGHFKPVWKMKTNEEGKIYLPLLNQYMKNDTVNFGIKFGDKRSKVRVNKLSKKHSDGVYCSGVKLK